MNDKEVGKLWARHDEPAHEYSCEEVRALIRKLVEERAFYYNQTPVVHRDFKPPESAELEACRDYGIDAKSWDWSRSK